MRRARPRRQLPPQSLALGASFAYAVIVGVGGSVLAALSDGDTSAPYDPGSWPDTVVTDTGYPEPTTPTRTVVSSLPMTTTTTTTTSGPSLDFVTVSGGGDIVTDVPAGWPRSSLSATVTEAADPVDPVRLLRYGGAPAADGRPLLERITGSDQEMSVKKYGYQQVRLESVEFHGVEAVRWEFGYYHDAGHLMRCAAHYWLAGGIEYVLYVQSRQSDWEATEAVLERMVESAGPVR